MQLEAELEECIRHCRECQRECVETLQQVAGHRTNGRVARLQVTSSRRCKCVILPRAAGASRYGRADAPHDQSPVRQPAERRVDGAGRDEAAASLLDMSADGSAVGVVAKRGHRKEDQLLEFAEVAHVCVLPMHLTTMWFNRSTSIHG